MKPYKFIALFLVIPALLLAGCSAGALTISPASNAPAANAPVTISQSMPAVLTQQQVSPGTLAAYEGTLEQIYQQVNPSVVNIQVTQNGTGFTLPGQSNPNSPFQFGNPGNQSQPTQSALGSGFVWDTQGHIVTNNHVVSGANQISVTFSDGSTVDAKLVGADPNSDLAVIQVNVPAEKLHPVQVGDSTQVKVGQLAIAIGNPFGLSGTMTAGIISALSRSLPVGLDNPNSQTGATYTIPDIIQTDASINPGNSGGVLVDDQGRLIGVTAAIESPAGTNAGIGFVIPSAIVQKEVPVLMQNGKFDHPYLGISGTSLTADLAKAMGLPATQQGALVIEVTPGGPAAKSGLRGGSSQGTTIDGQNTPIGGDVIVAIDGQPVKKFEDMVSYLLNNTQVGQNVTLTVLRNGKEQTIQVTLGTLPAQP